MKKLFSITTILVVFCFKSYSQDPLGLPTLLNSSADFHREFWQDIGYVYYDTNFEECIMSYENDNGSLTVFVDFSSGWKEVEEINIMCLSAEYYYRYFGYCTDNYLKINEDEGDLFLTLDFKSIITFSTKKSEDGGTDYYTIKIEHSKNK